MFIECFRTDPRGARLKLKLTICSFAQSEVGLLGHVVSDFGGKVDTDKIGDISEAPTPSNVTRHRRFLGQAGYYRRFIRNFTDKSAVSYPETSVKNEFE